MISNISDSFEGICTVVDRNSKIVFHLGEPTRLVEAHSTAKLIQVLPVYLLQLERKFQLSGAELAIMNASHLAQAQHIRVLESLMEKVEIEEDEMILPSVPPSGQIAYQNWKCTGDAPRRIYHACAGNHIALMLAQRELTGDTKGYFDKNSAVQRVIHRLIAQFYECTEDELELLEDGCGIPSYKIPVQSIAIAYKNMIKRDTNRYSCGLRKAIQRNLQVIKQYPIMLEGDDCLSTIITSHRGLVAKTGAEGLLAIGMERGDYGIVIKSDTEAWSDIANFTNVILNSLGYHDKILTSDLRRIGKIYL